MVTTLSRTDDQTKTRIAKLFQDLGLNINSAINLLLRQPTVSNGIPFTPHRGSATNVLARTEAETRIGAYLDSMADLTADLNATDQGLPHQSVQTRR